MAKKPAQANRRGIRAAWKDAARDLEAAEEQPYRSPYAERDGYAPGHWPGAPKAQLPPGCPVKVIGYDGPVYFIVSATGQLFEVENFDRNMIYKLFAPQIDFLDWAWPRFSAKESIEYEGKRIPLINGLKLEDTAACLIREGARRGLFDPVAQHRGRGGWRVGEEFIWHSGEYLWRVHNGVLECNAPGEVGGYLYTRQPDVIRPWEEPVDYTDTPATDLFQTLRTWNWERPTLDPLLVLGWLMTAFMGGALRQRPIVFTVGGAGVGKSTLQGVVRMVLGPTVFASSDTTAAGIYQKMKRDSLPAMIDELENKRNSLRAQAVIELARISYSGDMGHRGGAEGTGTSFNIRSSFFFSAINKPPLTTQDKTRMAVLNLGRLDKDAKKLDGPVVQDYHGRMLLRQVMDGWNDFWTRALPDWRETLMHAGFDQRAADTYGTLLAAAELALGAEVMEEAGLPITDQARLGQYVSDATMTDRAEQIENWQLCLEHLLGSQTDLHYGGAKLTVGGIIEDLYEGDRAGGDGLDLKNARARLVSGAGISIVERSKVYPGDKTKGYMLAVPPKGPVLARLFEASDWHSGGWYDALKGAPKHIVLRGKDLDVAGADGKIHQRAKVKINAKTENCVLIDLLAFEELTGNA